MKAPAECIRWSEFKYGVELNEDSQDLVKDRFHSFCWKTIESEAANLKRIKNKAEFIWDINNRLINQWVEAGYISKPDAVKMLKLILRVK